MNEYIQMFKRYFDFGGISTRREFWMAWLVNFIVTAILSAITAAVPALGFLTGVYSLVTLIPILAIEIRRLRDAGYGWGWIFINLIPLVGQIIYIVLLCKKSVATANNNNANNYAN